MSSFVGRDRGYRALGFLTATGVPVGPVATVKVGEPAGSLDGDWAVAVDADNRPLGWISGEQLSTPDAVVSADNLVSGGSLFEVDSAEAAGTAGSLRNALDAALSSPAAIGIAVDSAGAVVGGVTADDRAGGAGRRAPLRRGAHVNVDWPWPWLDRNWDKIAEATGQHLYLALLPVLAGLLISIPLGWAASRWSLARGILVPLAGVLYTIPSLALITLVPLMLGTLIIDPLNVQVPLAIYTVALLVRSVVRRAARGAG